MAGNIPIIPFVSLLKFMGILNPIFWAIHIHKSQHIFSTFFLTVFEVALLAKDGIYINDFPPASSSMFRFPRGDALSSRYAARESEMLTRNTRCAARKNGCLQKVHELPGFVF